MTSTVLSLASGDPLGHNYDYSILSYNGWAVMSNHILMMLTVTVFMLIAFPRVGRSVATGKSGTSHDYVTRGRFAHMMEVICVYMREQVAQPVMGKYTDRFMPFIWTVFFFVLFNNIIGMFPLMDVTALAYKALDGGGEHAAMVDEHGAMEHGEVEAGAAQAGAGHAEQRAEGSQREVAGHALAVADESSGDEVKVNKAAGWIWFHDLTNPGHSHFHGIGGTATGNIAVTFMLAVIAIMVVIASAIKNLGLKGFLHHLTLDAPMSIAWLTFILEIIGLIAKPFALMVRLFANMTAGHVMLAALVGFCSMAWNGIVTYMTQSGEVAISAVGFVGFIPIAVGSILFATAVGMLEVLVAFIQAFVFAFLTTMFISLFLPHEHDHSHDEVTGHDEGHSAAVVTV